MIEIPLAIFVYLLVVCSACVVLMVSVQYIVIYLLVRSATLNSAIQYLVYKRVTEDDSPPS